MNFVHVAAHVTLSMISDRAEDSSVGVWNQGAGPVSYVDCEGIYSDTR